MQEQLQRIAELVKEGYISGYYPCWILTAEWEDDVTDLGLEIIASQIEEGYHSGNDYDETIGLISWSIKIDSSIDEGDEDEDNEFGEGNGYSHYDSEDDYVDSYE